VVLTFCKVTQDIGDIHKVITKYLVSEQESRASSFDCQVTFSFVVAEMKDCRHRFCSAELSSAGLEIFTYIAMSFLGTPSTLLVYLNTGQIMQ